MGRRATRIEAGRRGWNAVSAVIAVLCAVSAGVQSAWAWELLFIVLFVINTIGALL